MEMCFVLGVPVDISTVHCRTRSWSSICCAELDTCTHCLTMRTSELYITQSDDLDLCVIMTMIEA